MEGSPHGPFLDGSIMGAAYKHELPDKRLSEQKRKELQDLINRHWAAEAHIVNSFFLRHRSKERDLNWIKVEMWRRSGGKGYSKRLKELSQIYPKVDRGFSRHTWAFILKDMASDYERFIQLAYAYEALKGARLRRNLLVAEASEEDWAKEGRKLEVLLETIIDPEDEVSMATPHLFGDYGLGLYSVLASLTENDPRSPWGGLKVRDLTVEAYLREMAIDALRFDIARAMSALGHMASICRDYMPVRYPEYTALFDPTQTQDWDQALGLSMQISEQRLRMRNDQFGNVLQGAELDSVIRLEVQPMNLVSLGESVGVELGY